MTSAIPVHNAASERAEIGLYDPRAPEGNSARWRISGYGASITIWTAEEWEKLTVRPADAQYYPCGVWCALRMD